MPVNKEQKQIVKGYIEAGLEYGNNINNWTLKKIYI
jgi:hypothetical protein